MRHIHIRVMILSNKAELMVNKSTNSITAVLNMLHETATNYFVVGDIKNVWFKNTSLRTQFDEKITLFSLTSKKVLFHRRARNFMAIDFPAGISPRTHGKRKHFAVFRKQSWNICTSWRKLPCEMIIPTSVCDINFRVLIVFRGLIVITRTIIQVTSLFRDTTIVFQKFEALQSWYGSRELYEYSVPAWQPESGGHSPLHTPVW